jgi:hypothetical protein
MLLVRTLVLPIADEVDVGACDGAGAQAATIVASRVIMKIRDQRVRFGKDIYTIVDTIMNNSSPPNK